MDASAFLALAMTCAPGVHAGTLQALVRVESGFNPWAIGVVGGQLDRQPRHHAEALATARALKTAGWNFSVGLGQIHVRNFGRLGLTLESAFDPCANLAAMQTVLSDCFDRAGGGRTQQAALRRALSCYYSGNFATGFQHGYVRRVVAASRPTLTVSPATSATTTQLKEKT
jgi:type IV secretion system protein VirB1